MSALFPLRPLQERAMEGRRDFYVYIIFRPNGVPCYVGKGCGRRWVRHQWRTHNHHLASIIALSRDALPKVKIRQGMTESDALTTEIAFIAAIGRETKGGPLVNQTDGGDGVSGFSWTAEQRAAMSLNRRGEKSPMFGKHHSEKSRTALRASRLGSKHSEETLSKMRAAQAGRKHSEETRAKMRAAHCGPKHEMFGKHHTEESKDKISAGGKGKRRSFETKQRIKIAQLRRYRSVDISEINEGEQ